MWVRAPLGVKGNEGQRQTLDNFCVKVMVRERKASKENQGRLIRVVQWMPREKIFQKERIVNNANNVVKNAQSVTAC